MAIIRRVGWVSIGIALIVAGSAWAGDPNPATIHSDRGAWPLYRQWTVAEVQHYARWIENIYRVKAHGTIDQRLAKLQDTLGDPEMNLLLDPAFVGEPSNPQLDPVTIQPIHSLLDCGKLTVTLGAYYAYRRGLPWMSTYIKSGDGEDVRTAAFTVPQGCASSFDYPSAHQYFVDAVQGFCTGNYRVEPDGERAELSDTVPVAIDPQFMLPGVLYYLDGHVLILAHVEPTGEIFFLDATTAASRDIYTHNGFNAVSGLTPALAGPRKYSGCYRGFRAYRLPIAEVDATGKVLRVRRRTDEEMREFGYSTEQYDVLRRLQDAKFIEERNLRLESFHDFVRVRMRTVDHVDPITVLDAFADRLVKNLEAREEHVQAAWREVQGNKPVVFPEGHRTQNVFNAPGRWRQWSSATMDASIRWDYFNVLNWMDAAVSAFESEPGFLKLETSNRYAVWGRGDVAALLARAKRNVFKDHTFQYTKSNGEQVTLNLLDFEARLYDLSFDPNHPPELRWGARPGSREAIGAPEMATPLPDGSLIPMAEAYKRESYYRTLTHRETDESYLREMFTEGFPIQQKMDGQLALWAKREPSPPLVPRKLAEMRYAARSAVGKLAAR